MRQHGISPAMRSDSMPAVAGGVPPDIVYFDRFAIGEWAGRNCADGLAPVPRAAERLDERVGSRLRDHLDEFYRWAVAEASYAPPGSNEQSGVYGIPATGDIRLLFSNSDLLRQEGMVDAKGNPKPPTTWEELSAAAVETLPLQDARRQIRAT